MVKRKIGTFSTLLIGVVIGTLMSSFAYFAISFNDERAENNNGSTIVKTE